MTERYGVLPGGESAPGVIVQGIDVGGRQGETDRLGAHLEREGVGIELCLVGQVYCLSGDSDADDAYPTRVARLLDAGGVETGEAVGATKPEVSAFVLHRGILIVFVALQTILESITVETVGRLVVACQAQVGTEPKQTIAVQSDGKDHVAGQSVPGGETTISTRFGVEQNEALRCAQRQSATGVRGDAVDDIGAEVLSVRQFGLLHVDSRQAVVRSGIEAVLGGVEVEAVDPSAGVALEFLLEGLRGLVKDKETGVHRGGPDASAVVLGKVIDIHGQGGILALLQIVTTSRLFVDPTTALIVRAEPETLAGVLEHRHQRRGNGVGLSGIGEVA